MAGIEDGPQDGLSAEQVTRIERNRLEALERLRRRQLRILENNSNEKVNSVDTTTAQAPPPITTTTTITTTISLPPSNSSIRSDLGASSSSSSSLTVPPLVGNTFKSSLEKINVRIIVQLESPKVFSTPAASGGGGAALGRVFRSIPGAKYFVEGNCWKFPLEQYETFLERLGPNKPANEDQLPKTVLALLSKDHPPQRKFDLSCIDLELRESLYPFQREGIEMALNRQGKVILADDMGLGKSIQALGIASYYRLEWPLLIISPASMVASWYEQVKRWITSLPPDQIRVFYDGKTNEFDGMVNILSYDLAMKLVPISKVKFNVIIVDECHALKNAESKRSKILVPILKAATRTILLSGTPALSRPLELYPQIQAVQPSLFPKFFDFGRRYCNGQQGYFGWDFKGASNLKELQLVLEQTIMIRRTKDDVLTQLPRKLRHQIFLKVNPKELETFRKLTELRGGGAISSPPPFDNIIKEEGGGGEDFQKKVEYMALWKRTAEMKLPSMLDYVDDLLESGHKMLIFAHHQTILDACEGHLLGKKVRFIRIDGRTAPAGRHELCQAFQTDPGLRVAVLSITAASTGLTLTAATTVVFAELFWNPGILLQAEDRAHRIGQSDAVNVHYLLARGTTDDSIWPLIIKKLTLLESVGLGKNDFKDIGKQDHDPSQMKLDRFLERKRPLRETESDPNDKCNVNSEWGDFI